MRRTYLSLAIAALATATLGPMQAFGGDREIAEQIIQRLKTNRDSGALKDFTLDMKVNEGVVLLRGNVAKDEMKSLVLSAADGIEGVNEIVDEVKVTPKAVVADAAPALETPEADELAVAVAAPVSLATPAMKTQTQDKGFSFKEALAAEAKLVRQTTRQPLTVMPGVVKPASAVEDAVSDQDVIASVVGALGRAQKEGQLKGFGVDVKCDSGVIQLTGRASSKTQRNTIIQIARNTAGVNGVRERITVPTALPTPALPSHAEPQMQARLASAPVRQLAPTPAMNAASMQHAPMQHAPMQTAPMQSAPMRAAPVSSSARIPAMTAPYRMQQAPMQARPASTMMGGGMPMNGGMGQPVPMAPHAAAGAPRHDSPNLPNYAWPGYAAHPNYASLTYPQQYSPTAWPYIGPFYPYPQVPLGWRKVSLEWDDGWWHLDFTDR